MFQETAHSRSSRDFYHSALSVVATQSGSEPRRLPVWGILQERVYKHHRIKDVKELRQRVEEEWDCLDQEVIDNVISEWRK